MWKVQRKSQRESIKTLALKALNETKQWEDGKGKLKHERGEMRDIWRSSNAKNRMWKKTLKGKF